MAFVTIKGSFLLNKCNALHIARVLAVQKGQSERPAWIVTS
jgi:hypothetical protein